MDYNKRYTREQEAWKESLKRLAIPSMVSTGNDHDHSGGDGAQIDHTTLSNIGTNTHAQIDTHISTVLSGTYTPTLTNVENLDASTAYVAQYMRVGSVVTVSGRVDVDPTTASVLTRLGISLPIASNFANIYECAGVASDSDTASESAAIIADTVNDRAVMRWVTVTAANHPMYFTFTYRII